MKSDNTEKIPFKVISRNNETGLVIIKLNFIDPSKISNEKDPDIIRMIFKDSKNRKKDSKE
jgi:hypothetical protein